MEIAGLRAMLARYGRMVPYLRREVRGIALILLLTLTAAGVAALLPWPIKLLVDHALGGAAPPPLLANLLTALARPADPWTLILVAGGASLLLYAANAALIWGLTWQWTASGQRMLYDLAGDLFAHLQRLSLLYHGRGQVGDLLGRITVDSWCIYSIASNVLVAPARWLLTIVSVSAVAFALDPLLTALLLGMSPVLAVSAHWFGERIKGRAHDQREAESRLASLVQQTLGALPVVWAFNGEARNQAHFADLGADVVRTSQRGVITKQAFGLVNSTALAIGTALVLFFGGQRVLSGAISIGSLLVFIAYVQTLRVAFTGLLETWGNLRGTEASLERVLEILDEGERISEAPNARAFAPRTDGAGLGIDFDGVVFGYQPGRPVLRGLDLHIRPGTTVALVGGTGAGKSTLASLVPRFFDPWSGQVLIDGQDVRELRLRDLRDRIALVLQEPFLLPVSIAENIAYACPEAPRERIIAAAVAANADEFIRKLPQGYDTPLGERGLGLSGGQRQRLAIARALLKDAPILILDEPTSALDNHTEALILEALERLMTNRTTLIIAHRLSTIRNADQIAVLRDGQVVERGRHEKLLAAGGEYWRFYSAASAGPPAAGG